MHTKLATCHVAKTLFYSNECFWNALFPCNGLKSMVARTFLFSECDRRFRTAQTVFLDETNRLGSRLRRERGVSDRHGRALRAGQSFHLSIELI